MIVGLTGGIASGKSLVTTYLSQLGIPVIDTDVIARQVVAIGQSAWRCLRESFGDAYFLPDGSLDRSAMASLVFHDVAARKRLEAITHPAIFTEVERQISEFAQQPSPSDLIVVVVPLLFESGVDGRFDATVLVSAPVEVQRERLQRTRGYTPEEADARIAAQLPLATKLACAHYVLDNSGSKAALRAHVRDWLRELRSRLLGEIARTVK